MKTSTLIVLLWINLFSYGMLFAQDTGLKDLPGTYRNASIVGALKTAPELNKLTHTDRNTLTQNLTKQHHLLMQTASLKSFTGMEARLYAYVQSASAFQKITTSEMRLMLYPFTKAAKTAKIVPVDEAPATLSVYTNNLDKILFHADGWWDVTKQVQFPPFFDKFPVIDSTADYITVRAKEQMFRILQLNDKPIFVPLTRKEFLQFLLKREEQLPQKEQADFYRMEIAQLTPEQAKSTAYINHNKSGGYYNQLAPAGRKDGRALYKINPDYFDKNKSRSAAQLIVVTYWYQHPFCPPWLSSYIKALFEEIDYNLLNSEMK